MRSLSFFEKKENLPKNELIEAKVIKDFVVEKYEITLPFECTLIGEDRGYNDHYLIKGDNFHYVFRVYLNGKYYAPEFENFQFELDLLEFVFSQGVPVSYPIPQKQEGTMAVIQTSEGLRACALFSYAEGNAIEEDTDPTPYQCFELGKAVASFHLAADLFHSQHHRHHLNEDYLVKMPLKFIEANWSVEQKAELPELAIVDELLKCFSELKKEANNYGIIHGDINTGNFHFTEDNQITLFDFDYCAYGWRAYDLTLAKEMEEQASKSFLDGYQSVRSLSSDELESISLLSQLAAIWDWGDELAIDLVR
ncbi:phosphotransferase [Iningainema tapete]|uniref:Phosphotransferase n=1 Tax=Iningainema tapete BLCC-T55 TaxID=2748662 RepID=A0A8J6XPX5_9CYAN|nr:phosphotransferase [Iningainema tapete]MBD2776020.1 phosphotransferase [Iningainema tapete BLCC-T55]